MVCPSILISQKAGSLSRMTTPDTPFSRTNKFEPLPRTPDRRRPSSRQRRTRAINWSASWGSAKYSPARPIGTTCASPAIRPAGRFSQNRSRPPWRLLCIADETPTLAETADDPHHRAVHSGADGHVRHVAPNEGCLGPSIYRAGYRYFAKSCPARPAGLPVIGVVEPRHFSQNTQFPAVPPNS